MGSETFVDTSGFYALLVKRDDKHQLVRKIMQQAAQQRQKFVTTDYVLDETGTLLKARGHAHLIERFFDNILDSKACRVEWTDADRFSKTRILFLKYPDHDWSFTDCLSFQVMRELGLRDALTKDAHFREAGFTPLLRE